MALTIKSGVRQGETFIVRSELPLTWKQAGLYRKFVMTYLHPDAPTATIDTVDGGINIFDQPQLIPMAPAIVT